MPAPSTKKRPPMEMEAGPDEIREGEDDQEMPIAGGKTNRKRSAKGAKNTKPAMDGDCGCMGKGRKGKCDVSCGKKMDRNDALTPQEYLAACELGIQGRSRSYIRARLDSAARLDLKCGNGAISQGEKCHVGTAQKAASPARSATGRNQLKRAAGNAAIAVGTVGNLATAYGALRGLATANPAEMSKAIQRQAAFSALAGAGQHLKASGTTNKQERAELKKMGNASLTTAALGGVAGHYLGGGYTKGLSSNLQGTKRPNFTKTAANFRGQASAFKGTFTQRKTRSSLERMYRQPGRRDSVYAAGFSPELDQLAL